jgi:hypothetical protein
MRPVISARPDDGRADPADESSLPREVRGKRSHPIPYQRCNIEFGTDARGNHGRSNRLFRLDTESAHASRGVSGRADFRERSVKMVWRTAAEFRGTPAALAMATFLFAAVLSAFLVLRSEEGVRQQRRIELTEQAADKAFEIEHAVERALTATYALAALVRQGHGNVANFEEVGAELIPFYPGADSLQLAPGGIIRRIVPLAGNERALGHDLLADPARNKEAFLARDTGRLTLAGPFDLMQGGIGAVGRLPVFIDDASGTSRFWGFVTVLIRFPEALSAAQLPQLAKRGVD